MRFDADCSGPVAALCTKAAQRLSNPVVHEQILDVRSRLHEPLRVAVAGRVKSGKSTLVNALLRHDVAPTAYGECTKAVTWFRYGYPPEARLVFAQGATRSLALEPGQRLPATLGADASELDHVEVSLSSDALESLTVIDTPGLASSHDEYSAATRRALALGAGLRGWPDEDEDDLARRSEDAASQADALVFVLSGAMPKRDEVDVLEAFRSHLGGMRASAVNTVTVLNQADLLGENDSDEDPLQRARRLVGSYAEQLGALTAAVIPTVGLIGETAEAGLLTERDATALRHLAVLDDATRLRLLDNVGWFVGVEVGVEVEQRQRLLDLLGLYGIGRCLEWVKEDDPDTPALRESLSELSGVRELRTLLVDLFSRRADVLKAANALARLERLARDPALSSDEQRWLATEVERTRLHPSMHALATTWAFAQVAAGAVQLPEELAENLRRAALGTSVEEKIGLPIGAEADALQAAAMQSSAMWRGYLNGDARSDQKRIASVLCQHYSALWQMVGAESFEEVGNKEASRSV